MNSSLFKLHINDFLKGLVVAVLSGCALPILAALQTPNFDIHTVSWQAVWVLAENGAVAGFASYLVKNFFSDNAGRVMGVLG